MLESFLNLLHRYRRVTLALGVLSFLGLGAFSLTLTVNDSPERWFPASTVEAWDRFQEHYEYGDTLVVGVQFQRAVRDEDFAFLQNLRRRMLAIEGVEEVTDASLVAEKIERVPLTTLIEVPTPGEPDPYELYRGAFFDDPRVWRDAEHAADEGRTLLVVVLLEDELPTGLSEDETADVLNARRRHVAAEMEQLLNTSAREAVTFHLGGGIIVQHEMERIATKLVLTLVPLSLLLLLVSLGIGFRSWGAVAVATLGGGWAVAVMLGCVALFGWSLNVVTVAGPILMAVIIVTTTVHFAHYYTVTSHKHNVTPSEHEHEDELARATRTHESRAHFAHWVAMPCLGAAITTGFGFLMLAFNELQPARELGIELFAGSVLAFFGGYLAWIALAPLKASRGVWFSADRLERLERAIVRQPRVTTAIFFLALIGLAIAAREVRVDADPFSFFRADSGPGKALAHFGERKFGYYVLDVVMVPKDNAPAKAELHRRKVRDFEEAIRQRPEIRKIISTAGWQTRLAEWEARRDEAQAQIAGIIRPVVQLGTGLKPVSNPIQSAAVLFSLVRQGNPAPSAQPEHVASIPRAFSAIAEYGARSMAVRNVFSNWLNDKAGQGTFRATFMVYDPGTGFRPLLDDVRAHLPEEHFDCFYTGTAASVAVLSEQLMGGITRGMLFGTLAMTLVCLALFRSVKLTLIAVAPNAFPILVVFGFMGLLDIPLNCGSAMVTTIALGVSLNDTVHFLMHYRGRRLEGADTASALTGIFGEIGRPIILTSVVNSVGFGIFLFSDFLPMAHFGLLASISMAAALLGDLILLPNLLTLFDPSPEPATLPEEMAASTSVS